MGYANMGGGWKGGRRRRRCAHVAKLLGGGKVRPDELGF